MKVIDIPYEVDEEDFNIIMYQSPPLVKPQRVLGLLTWDRRNPQG